MFPNSSSSLQVEVAGLNRGLNAHTPKWDRSGRKQGRYPVGPNSAAAVCLAWTRKTELEADAQEEEVADAA